MIEALPRPYAFPIGSQVMAGPYRGEVIGAPGPYSVVIREISGRRLITTTTDMAPDDSAVKGPPAKAREQFDIFSFLEQ